MTEPIRVVHSHPRWLPITQNWIVRSDMCFDQDRIPVILVETFSARNLLK